MSDTTTLHASSIAHSGRGLLIRGAAQSGKSSLALALMALGADLVSDDQTRVSSQGRDVILNAPESIAGLIEAHGIGILHANPVIDVPLHAVVDLDAVETERLPPLRETVILGRAFPLVRTSVSPHFPCALLHFLRFGRAA